MIQQAKISLIMFLIQTWHYLFFSQSRTFLCGCNLENVRWSWVNVKTALPLFLLKDLRILCWIFPYSLPCLSKRSQLSLQQSRSGIFQWNVCSLGNDESQKAKKKITEIIEIQENLADTGQDWENDWSCNSQTCHFPLPSRGVPFTVLDPLEDFSFITKKPVEAFVLSWNNRFSGFLLQWNFKVSVVHLWGTSEFEQIYTALVCYV